ncbi:sensor domain-containing diguanylate cyclase [Noviherbaspirillum pedocola]|uniref:Diguanylate cyclase n=1 Tax=Noviherbaspirillum pedocola TaxID=2801341 RepID=A0A934SZ21_9BURK|nr:diguanylate cyclase [Noviherbaspirillum pedocola]MBK4738337.1 diguanylate cyclase [Noviherbaspirillum pedocola]
MVTSVPLSKRAEHGYRFSSAIFLWPVMGLLTGLLFWGFVQLRLEKEYANAEQAGMQKATSLSRAYAAQLRHTIGQLDQLTLQLRYEWRRHPGKPNFEEQLAEGLYPLSSQIYALIIDRNGNLVDSTLGKSQSGINVADRDFFRQLQTTGFSGLQVSGPEVARLTGMTVLRFSRALTRSDGSFDGAAVVAVQPQYLASFQDMSNASREDFVSLMGSDGRVLAASRETGVVTDTVYRHAPSFPGEQGVARISAEHFLDDVPRFVAWQTLQPEGLLAVVGIAESSVFAAYDKTARDYRSATVTASAFLLLFVFIGMIYTARLTWKKELAEEIGDTYRLALEGGREGFFMVRALFDMDGGIEDFVIEVCNERGAAYAGQTRTRLVGQRISGVWPPRQAERIAAVCRHAMRAGFHEDEVRTPALDETRPLWLHRRFVRYGRGLAITVRDISDARAHQEALSRMAHADVLTGLPNRAWLMRHLPQAITRARRQNRMLAVMFIDLDDFKSVNDSHGHAAGDALLQVVARRLSGAVRGRDHVARLAGDEFTVVLEDVEGDEVVQIVERIMAAMSEPFLIGNSHRHQTLASIGISRYPEDGEDMDALLRAADAAMYCSKSTGKGRYVFYQAQDND